MTRENWLTRILASQGVLRDVVRCAPGEKTPSFSDAPDGWREETNAELRDRIKTIVTQQSHGRS